MFINYNDINKYENSKSIIINYSEDILNSKNVINIIPSYLFSNKYLNVDSMPKTPLKLYNNTPIIYTNNELKPYLKKIEGTIVTNMDIVQSSFFMVTRYEEIIFQNYLNEDSHDRFLATQSLAFKEKFLHIPVVNEYIEWLWDWISYYNLGYKRKKYWGKYDLAACLTHDVDMPFKFYYPIKNTIKKLKNEKLFNGYKNLILHTLSSIDYKRDPYFKFNYIRQIERQNNFHSSFYFMNGGSSIYENFYDINDKRIIKLIKYLEKDNCEIGYHYSYNAYNDINIRKKEKKYLDNILKNKKYGGRNHYLRFSMPESWQISNDVNLLYDSTLGYCDHEGFRCGICFPYKVFNVFKREELDLIEIPLIIMEGTLFENEYRGLSINEAINVIKKIIDTIRRYNGVITILWHNSFFDPERYPGWSNVFEETMKYLRYCNCLGESGRKILDIM